MLEYKNVILLILLKIKFFIILYLILDNYFINAKFHPERSSGRVMTVENVKINI